MKTAQKLVLVGVIVAALGGLRFYLVRQAATLAAAPRLEAGATVPHMDHTPRHGGLVLMRGDTHFEVVLSPGGFCQVYFTDAARAELPASFAAEVELGFATLNGSRQNVPFEVDPEGKMWIGRVQMPSDPQTIVRVTYVAQGEQPYWIDVPLSAWPNA